MIYSRNYSYGKFISFRKEYTMAFVLSSLEPLIYDAIGLYTSESLPWYSYVVLPR